MAATPNVWHAGALVSPGQVVEPPSQLYHAYKATQAAAGRTGATEPVWPTGAGATVADGAVTWTEIAANTITWTAQPAYLSGGVEPVWPTTPGGTVVDGSITWKASVPFVSDAKCPHSKLVLIAASKVYAGDDDIISYSATVNPLDWSTADDAGYLAFGLNTYGANPVAAMGLYRSNLVAFNTQGFQMYQVDPDPALTSLITALPLGSSQHRALVSVGDDAYYFSSRGVRSISLSAGSDSLQSGDIGMPVDEPVMVAFRASVALGYDPIGTYYPAAGQYWIAFRTDAGSTVWVYTRNRIGEVGAWSYYLLPFPIDHFTRKDDDLYIRSGDDVLRVDDTLLADFVGDDVREVTFDALIQYNWLDLGSPGVNKRMIGFDIVGSGTPRVSVGYDQTNPAAFTTPFEVPADTLPGPMIPLQVKAPSFSLRIQYAGGQAWHFQALNLYLADSRLGT